MARAHIKDKEGNVIQEFYMDDKLKRNLDEKVIKQIQSKDKDFVMVIDGREGSGKSTLAMQIGKYVDPTLDLDKIVFSAADFKEAVLKAKKGECIIYDEAFTGFSSRSSLSPVNKVLVSLAMQMRQKNLFIIIVLPTIFMLDRYMALFRTKVLLHVYEVKGNRGYFRQYNSSKKKYLILMGRKTMSYNIRGTRPGFAARFYGKFVLGTDETNEKLERAYRRKKEDSLDESEQTNSNQQVDKLLDQRNRMIILFKEMTGVSYRKLSILLKRHGITLHFDTMNKIYQKLGLDFIKEDQDDLMQYQKEMTKEKKDYIEEVSKARLKDV